MVSNTNAQTVSFDLTSKQWIIWSLFIFSAVCIFNIPYAFFDGLVHDDSFWFYQATEDDIFIGGRGQVSALVPYMDYLYAKGMLHLGTDFLRSIYIGGMALASISVYLFYRNVFLFKEVISIPASIIPNILPSLMIPLGFNASYAIWQIFPFFLSLVCLYKASRSDTPKPKLLYWLGFLLYCFTLNVSVAGTFLIPSTFLILILYLEKEKLSKVFIKSLPFIIFAVYHLYKHAHYSHKTPVIISIDVILDRAQQFFEMANIFLIDNYIGSWVVLTISVLGLIAIYVNSQSLGVLTHAALRSRRLFIVIWVLCWLAANSVAYLALSPSFRPHDYAYAFNYGTVLLLVSGLASCYYLLRRFITHNALGNNSDIVFIVVMVCFVGFQRVYTYYNSQEISIAEKKSEEIRLLLSTMELPINSQIILLGVDVPHKGVTKVNSGYTRYLTGRNDVNALIGFDRYPLDPFRATGSWQNPMKGLDIERPVILFQRVNNSFERVNYLLQTTVNNAALPRFIWHLFDISSPQYPPRLVQKGNGLKTYGEYIDRTFTDENRPFVAFSPSKPADRVISEEQAKAEKKKGITFDKELNFSNVLTLINLQKTVTNEKVYLQLLIHINKHRKHGFKLGYKISGEKGIHTLDSSDYLSKGDYVLIYHALSNLKADISVLNIQFFNTGVWPYKQIALFNDNNM